MRNAEVIRQWYLLRMLESTRQGVTVQQLAQDLNVTTRTIWRDLAALQEVGFPLIDEKDGRQSRWKLAAPAFRGLSDLGISLVELCSLYMGRAMVAGMAGAPFGDALATMCGKLETSLPPRMREFLDRLPALIEAKPGAVKKRRTRGYDEHIGKLLDATLQRRICTMRYFSASSGRIKDYIVHPYRLVHADGGMYVLGWVPDYAEVRTFAVERIQKLSLAEERFDPAAELPPDVFGQSLGVNRGRAEAVVITFAARVAPHIRERTWHKSQRLQDLPGGGVRMTLTVCCDWSLRSWVLGFGPFARVESPGRLAQEILEQLEEAREAYAPRLDLALPRRVVFGDHPRLPGLPRLS
jgi:predicted DNA-binding transcriptional regulator YafY